jgi:hypothetical protein
VLPQFKEKKKKKKKETFLTIKGNGPAVPCTELHKSAKTTMARTLAPLKTLITDKTHPNKTKILMPGRHKWRTQHHLMSIL